jgi:1-acyl-sn-glycerol-3-phosphate acyltransferase
MGRDNIEKYSLRYDILKAILKFWHNNVFYRRVIVLGRENINPDDHLIYAPNHQNALMDALAVLFTHKGQPIFLARADIFKKKFVASLLYFLKMLPVYRIRDGYSTLKENDVIFNKTIDVLRNKNGLVILPEGDHAGFRRLRQLKKGICRIAFQADEASGFNLKIKIIPVGLEFTHYSRFRQVLTVVYGKPIDTSLYHELYRNNPEIALNELRKKLASEMKKLMVHIDSEEDYEAIDELRSMVNGRFSDNIRFPKLFRDRILIDKLNKLKENVQSVYQRICSLSLQIKKKATELNIDYRLLEKRKHPLVWLILGIMGILVTIPLFLYGSIFNLIFIYLPDLKIRRMKDQQFLSSFRYGISLAIALIVLPSLLILSLVLISPWWLALLVFVTFPLAGLFAWNYVLVSKRITGGFRIWKYRREKREEYFDLKKCYEELLTLIASQT